MPGVGKRYNTYQEGLGRIQKRKEYREYVWREKAGIWTDETASDG